MRAAFLFAMALAAAIVAGQARAEARTVCTITVNSSDEKEAIRKRLPQGQYRFVELLEPGRPDWLRTSCQKGVTCDVLVVSGHFNAGDDFYSDRIDNGDYLRVDELERASCSDSCPGIFSKLKEVYLFGCESLDADATRNATHGESSRERMRRIFAGVPVIYGFSSAAPVGATAAMLLNRYFDAGGAAQFGSGRPSPQLKRIFSRNSISSTSGAGDLPAEAARRRQACQFFDERLAAGEKLAGVHRMLREDVTQSRAFLDRIEKLFASLDEAQRQAPGFRSAIEAIAADQGTRERYLAAVRGTREPAIRVRMAALARSLGWLSEEQLRAEHGRMIGELLARDAVGFAEVDLVCALNADRALDAQRARIEAPAGPSKASHAAVLACLGSREAHERVVQALASGDERDVQVAQAYLRHRPVADAELRAIALGVARMPGSAAQVRALETLARLRITDREILDELALSFAGARSVNVQRAIAEVFIRSDYRRPELATVLREHRLSPPGRGDLIDVLLGRLPAS